MPACLFVFQCQVIGTAREPPRERNNNRDARQVQRLSEFLFRFFFASPRCSLIFFSSRIFIARFKKLQDAI